MQMLEINPTPEQAKRLFACFEKNDNGCWVWIRGKDQFGYGMTYIHNKRERAHRVMYSWFKGPIPRGKAKQLDHLCLNKSCVNPEHLELVSPRENIYRGDSVVAKGMRRKKCIHGHDFVWVETKRGKRRYCKTCDSLRHKKRKNGPRAEYWANKNRQAVKRYYDRHLRKN